MLIEETTNTGIPLTPVNPNAGVPLTEEPVPGTQEYFDKYASDLQKNLPVTHDKNAPATSEPLLLSSQGGADKVAETTQRLNQIAPTQPQVETTATPSNVYEKLPSESIEQYKTRIAGFQGNTERPKEEPVTLEEAGTLPDTVDAQGNKIPGEKLYLDPTTGLIETLNQISARRQREADLKAKTEQAITPAEQELADAKANLAAFKLSDAALQEQVNSIGRQWDARMQEMRNANERRQKSIQTLGIRLGSRWTGGAGGSFGGIIAEEERQGIMRIGEIEAQKQASISAAMEAARKQNWDVYVKQVDLAEKAVENQRKAVEDANKASIDQQRLFLDKMKEGREQDKSDLENSEKLIKSIGYLALNNLTGDPEKDAETIKSISSLYKVDPNMLWSEAQRLQAEKIKNPAGIVGEYLFYVAQAEQAGLSANQIMDFNAYQNVDANRKALATGMGGLNPKQTQNFLTITNKFQSDEIIKNGDNAFSTIAIANQVLADPGKATNQLKALYSLVKSLDPNSAVREGELALAQQAQSYLGRFATSLQRIYEGKLLNDSTTIDLANATIELANAWKESATNRTRRYSAQAGVAGVGDAFTQYLSASQPIEKGTITAPDGQQIIITD